MLTTLYPTRHPMESHTQDVGGSFEMMANHRTLAFIPFDLMQHSTLHAYTHCTLYEGQSPTCTCTAHDLYTVHGDQLLGQPITNENTSFVFEFGILALMSSALNFGRSINA